jgi:hypothetical protein
LFVWTSSSLVAGDGLVEVEQIQKPPAGHHIVRNVQPVDKTWFAGVSRSRLVLSVETKMTTHTTWGPLNFIQIWMFAGHASHHHAIAWQPQVHEDFVTNKFLFLLALPRVVPAPLREILGQLVGHSFHRFHLALQALLPAAEVVLLASRGAHVVVIHAGVVVQGVVWSVAGPAVDAWYCGFEMRKRLASAVWRGRGGGSPGISI